MAISLDVILDVLGFEADLITYLDEGQATIPYQPANKPLPDTQSPGDGLDIDQSSSFSCADPCSLAGGETGIIWVTPFACEGSQENRVKSSLRIYWQVERGGPPSLIGSLGRQGYHH